MPKIQDSAEDYGKFEEVRVKHLFFHAPAEHLMTESQDLDPDDEQIRALLASSLYLQEHEAGAERLQVDHSERENLMQSSSQDLGRTGKLVSLFSCRKKVESRNDFRQRQFASKISTFFWK